MTKKEKAELEAAKTLAALRWTAEVEPDVPAPSSYGDETTTGYLAHGYYGGFNVRKGWSEAVRHGDGEPREYGGSKEGRALFSTELLAAKAARHMMEKSMAAELRKIDRYIETMEAQ